MSRRRTFAILAIGGALLGACASNREAIAPAVAPNSPDQTRPRTVSDLAALSPANTTAALGRLIITTPITVTAPQVGQTASQSQSTPTGQAKTDEDLRRLFLETPETAKFAGSAHAPGEQRLLNAKASQFPQFSRALLNQVFIAAQAIEVKEMTTVVLTDKLPPAVITATMDKNGKLTEMTLEKSSGSGAVDQLLIKACKKGLWATNPPVGALTPDGVYLVRVEGQINAFNRVGPERIWNFETLMGLGLL